MTPPPVALIQNDIVVFGLIAATLGAVFWTSARKRGPWQRFYAVVPALLLCYLLPGIYNTVGLIDGANTRLYNPIARDVLLPAASWGEKDGTVTNSERCITRVRKAVEPPGQARADWWIAREVARRLEARLAPQKGAGLFAFDTPAQIFDEHRALTVGRDLDIGGLDHAALDARGPQQWPFPAGATQGQARRYTDGVFATPNGRARFHATPYRKVAEPTSARFPMRLLTGRLRDQWHGMSRSGRVPGAFAHSPEPALRMHPDDAVRRGLQAGELVRVASKQ